MRDRITDIESAGAQLLAVDPHEAWAGRFLLKEVGFGPDDVRYPLLLDPTYEASAAYGVAFQMRIHTELSNRPATFIIDREGIIRYARRGKRFNDRPSPDEILDELNRLKQGQDVSNP